MTSIQHASYRILKFAMVLMMAITTFCGCSDDEERMAPTYYFKVTNVSNELNENSNALFHLNSLIVLQYDEGVQYFLADEKEALAKYEQTVKFIQQYDWEGDGFILKSGSYFTLQLISNENKIVASQTIVLKR